MPKLPTVSAKQTIKALSKIGFIKISQRGSHIKLEKKTSDYKQSVIIPNHKQIRKDTLKNGILNSVNLSVAEFIRLLKI